MLTKKQLKQLRKEIRLNSLFLNDYENTFYIKKENVYDFFDGYLEYLYEIANENGFKSNDVFDVVNEYDNIDNLWNWYLCFDDDPLLQNDFIGCKHINNFDGIAIYEIDYEYMNPSVMAAFIIQDGLYMRNTKLKTYKLYNSKYGYYFNLNKKRHYLNSFMAVNNEK